MGTKVNIQNLAKNLRSKLQDRDGILATIDALETSWNIGDREEVKKLSGKLYEVISKDIITGAQRGNLKDMKDGKSKPEKRKKPPTTAEQTNQEGPCDKDEMNRKATKSTEEGGVKESASPDKTAKQSDKEEGNNSQQKETSDKEDAKQDDEVQKPSASSEKAAKQSDKEEGNISQQKVNSEKEDVKQDDKVQKPSETDAHEETKALEEKVRIMKTLETENGTLQAEKDQALKEVTNLKETIKAKVSELESLKETNKTKDSELESLKETNKTKDSELESLKETIKTKDSELESFKESIKTKDSKLESLQETIKAKNCDHEKLTESISKQETEFQNKYKAFEESAEKELKKLKSEAQKEINELKEEKVRLKTDLEKAKKRIDKLQSEMDRNNLKLERSETFLQESQERNDELSTRLSKAVGDKLTHNNPNIADLSDGNRPTKLAERYSELYDNEWTDAYEILEKIPNRKVEETVSILRKILLDCYDVCMKTADVQMQHIKSLFLHPPTNGEIGDGKEEFKFSEGQENMLSSLRKETADQSHKALVKVILKKHRETKSDAMKKFIKTCTDLCWKMAIQTPPVFIDTMDRRDELFDNNMFKAYTSVGKYVDFVVWPPLYLHENGSMLSKGIAQGKKGKGK